MRPRIWVCIALFAVAMAGVNAAAKWSVASFGALIAIPIIATLYFGARYFERRR